MDYTNKSLKEEILYWSKRLYQKDLSPALSGNISIRTPDGILISASGTCLNDMDENDIVLIDLNGNLIEGNKKPSSEKIMHCEIYSKRDDIKAIIHSHCPSITAFAVADTAINKAILPDFIANYDEIPVVPYYCPSSIELATSTGEYFEKYDAVLLKNHGIVLGDNSLQNAYYKLEMLKAYTETYFGAQVIGSLKTLNKKQSLEIKQLYSKNRR